MSPPLLVVVVVVMAAAAVAMAGVGVAGSHGRAFVRLLDGGVTQWAWPVEGSAAASVVPFVPDDGRQQLGPVVPVFPPVSVCDLDAAAVATLAAEQEERQTVEFLSVDDLHWGLLVNVSTESDRACLSGLLAILMLTPAAVRPSLVAVAVDASADPAFLDSFCLETKFSFRVCELAPGAEESTTSILAFPATRQFWADTLPLTAEDRFAAGSVGAHTQGVYETAEGVPPASGVTWRWIFFVATLLVVVMFNLGAAVYRLERNVSTHGVHLLTSLPQGCLALSVLGNVVRFFVHIDPYGALGLLPPQLARVAFSLSINLTLMSTLLITAYWGQQLSHASSGTFAIAGGLTTYRGLAICGFATLLVFEVVVDGLAIWLYHADWLVTLLIGLYVLLLVLVAALFLVTGVRVMHVANLQVLNRVSVVMVLSGGCLLLFAVMQVLLAFLLSWRTVDASLGVFWFYLTFIALASTFQIVVFTTPPVPPKGTRGDGLDGDYDDDDSDYTMGSSSDDDGGGSGRRRSSSSWRRARGRGRGRRPRDHDALSGYQPNSASATVAADEWRRRHDDDSEVDDDDDDDDDHDNHDDVPAAGVAAAQREVVNDDEDADSSSSDTSSSTSSGSAGSSSSSTSSSTSSSSSSSSSSDDDHDRDSAPAVAAAPAATAPAADEDKGKDNAGGSGGTEQRHSPGSTRSTRSTGSRASRRRP